MARSLWLVAVCLVTLATAATASPPAKQSAKTAKGVKAPPPAGSDSPGSGSGPAAGSATDDDTAAGSDSAAEQMPPHITGPKLVDLGNNISVDLPAEMILFEAPVAKKLIEEGGNSADNVLAVITKPGSSWGLTVDYDSVGYVDDGDADKLDADELFGSYKDGVEEQNKRRKEMGLPDMVLDGWSEMPRYDRAVHHLNWGLKGHSTNGVFINFFTRVLGRNGYMSIDLIDSPENIEKAKLDAQPVMNAIKFGQNARYEDHASSDKDSGISLKTLILGGAGVAVAAKTGLILKLLLIFKKGIIFLVAGIAGLFRWITGKKKKLAVEPTPGTPPPSDPQSPPPPSEPPASV